SRSGRPPMAETSTATTPLARISPALTTVPPAVRSTRWSPGGTASASTSAVTIRPAAISLASPVAIPSAWRRTMAVASARARRSTKNSTGRPRTRRPPSATPIVDNTSRWRTGAIRPSVRASARLEPEADPPEGGDQLRGGRVVSEFLPQPGAVHVEGFRRAVPVLVPDLPHDAVPGDGAARVGGQPGQEGEL